METSTENPTNSWEMPLSPPSTPPSTPPSRPTPIFFIFDAMRTRSHLFFRYLSTHAKFHPIYHPYLNAAILGEERWAKPAECCEERRFEIWEGMKLLLVDDTFESLNEDLRGRVEEGQRGGRIPLINDHIPNLLQEEILYGLHRNTMTIEEAMRTNPTHTSRIPSTRN
ncbi:uncharacterized protein RCC_01561 [Ramularia collo-cygni]|uniref:Uncharacterized protein n=1 Tax=Ramularia collo-cygni TaxID=112498 RepID=A0A2D3UUN9_9PEZI|nr:uncharacterized protein RCC_01561 [Ramularia collo-cygni]CZT15727.1 uncharacterized protein RCC_01561 [Ramularia collo-cygni]